MPKLLLALCALLGCATLALTQDADAPATAPEGRATAQGTAEAEPALAIDGRPTHLAGWQDLDCAGCHEAITEEWAQTLHAQAWIDQRYQDAVATKRRPQSCYGCHIPEPLHSAPLGSKPRPRADTPDDPHHSGVSCLSCHLGPDGVMLGPYESGPDDEISGAHASRQGENFLPGKGRDALCITCHRTNVGPVIGIAKDFEATRQADRGRSCVGCHMSKIERPAAVVTREDGSVYTAPVRKGRSHVLNTPRDPGFLARAFELEPAVTAATTELVIRNDAGHRVPGLKTRSMTFVVTALGADGAELGQGELRIDAASPLPADGALRVAVETGGLRPASLAVRAVHDWIGVEQPVVFLEETLEL